MEELNQEVSGVEEQTQVAVEPTEVPQPVVESGAEKEVAAEPNNFEKAFAKRLAAKEAEWEAKNNEKYKDYDTHKQLSEYFQKINNSDALTLKERVEMEKLQERADQANVPPEVMKRLDELEAKAAKGDELEKKQQEDQRVTDYFSIMEKVLKDKGVNAQDLNQFMVDNEMHYNPNAMEKSFELALKAFKADDAIAKLETAKKDAVNEYLSSKKGVKVEGAPGSASVQAVDTKKMSWDQLDRHVLERVKAMNTPQ